VETAIILGVLLFSVVAHEVAHAWQARWEGDYTAARLGRITLNPLPHLDPFGSVLLPLLLHFSGAGFIFGWARPVPTDPSQYRSRVAGNIRVSLAGIFVNLVLAGIFTLFASFGVWAANGMPALGGITEIVGLIAFWGIVLNLVLALFNLIPIPPLDGSHVFQYLLPMPLRRIYWSIGRFGIFIVVALLWLVPGASSILLEPLRVLLDAALQFAASWG